MPRHGHGDEYSFEIDDGYIRGKESESENGCFENVSINTQNQVNACIYTYTIRLHIHADGYGDNEGVK